MEQYILALVIVKIKDPIISWTQFPDVFFQMFGDIDRQIGAVFCEQVDVEDNLVVLDRASLLLWLFTRRASRKSQTSDSPC